MRLIAGLAVALLLSGTLIRAEDGSGNQFVNRDESRVFLAAFEGSEPTKPGNASPTTEGSGVPYDVSMPPIKPRETMATLGFDIAYEQPTSGEIEFINRYTVMGGGGDDGVNFGAAFFSVGDVSFKSGGLADRAATNPLVFDLGGLYRRYFFERSALVNPYVVFSGSAELLTWAYREDRIRYDETIGADCVWGIGAQAGLGVAINRGRRLAAFAELTAGGMFYYAYTWYGFENDAFDNYGFWSVRAGIQYAF